MSSVSSSAVLGTTSLRSANEQPSTPLSEYGSALLRRWWLVVLGLVIGGVAAGGYLAVASKVYTSTATVQVTDTGAADSALPAGSRNNSGIDMDTEAQILKSNTVAALAAKELHTTEGLSALTGKVKVTVPPNSAVLSIQFQAGNARDARAGAQAFADSYLSNRIKVAQGVTNDQLASLEGQLPALQRQLSDVSAQTVTLPPNSPQRAYALAQQTILSNKIDALNAAITPLQQSVTPGRLISPATLPTSASSPQKVLVLLSGILGGLLLGAVMALMAIRHDRRIHRSSEFVSGVGLPLLATVPNAGVKTSGLMPAASAGASAIRELRDRVVGSGVDRSVLVVPLSAVAGGSLVAVNLASSLAADGSSCALVCASPESVVPLRLRLTPGAGLSEALTYGFTDVRSTLVHTQDRRFGVLMPGHQPASLLDRLHGTAMRETVHELREAYDHVVVEAPVWSENRSSLVLGRAADVVILVAETRLTTREELAEASELLTAAGAIVLGTVLVPRLRGTGLSSDASRAGRDATKATGSEAEGTPVAAQSAGSSPNAR